MKKPPDQGDLFSREPDHPRARGTDPWTAHAADRDLTTGATHRRTVFWILARSLRGLLHEQGQRVMEHERRPRRVSRGAFRKRCNELHKDWGVVEDSGSVGLTKDGRWAIRWRINERGYDLWEHLAAGGKWPPKKKNGNGDGVDIDLDC